MHLDTIKAGVRELRPYSLRPYRARVKLNQNENAWDAPVEIRQETLRRLEERRWSRYPDFTPERLRERLAEFAGWTTEGVLAGNGSNELIQALLMVTIEKGNNVLINEPTFALYRQVTTILGGETTTVSLSSDLSYDTNALIKAVETSRPRVTIICSPNNPTGCLLGHADLASLLGASTGLVAVDEAYFEFSGQTVVSLLKDYPNLVVLRTFSKAMALAGLRVGYLLSAPQLVQEIAKALLPYNLNIVSQIAAEVALELFPGKLKPLVQNICDERDRVYAELTKIPGLEPVRSAANFMVVRSSVVPSTIFNELLKRDILIRDVSRYPMLQDYFRISIGTPEENDLLLTSLREVMVQNRLGA
jgi:histidinol-phosphate aminotransferase